MEHGIVKSMHECIKNCTECHNVCVATANHCFEKSRGDHSKAGHVTLLLDCADICQSSANFMLRGSEHHRQTCAACASVCEHCARACEEMADDEMMRLCTETCRRCADSCSRMSVGTA